MSCVSRRFADCPEIRVGVVHHQTTARGAAHDDEKHNVYAALVAKIDDELRDDGLIRLHHHGWPGDPRYRDAHRVLKLNLDDRHVIEDPAYRDSRMSQWTQMADLIAYIGYTQLYQHPGNAFGWTWFEDYLVGAGTLEAI